MEISGILKLNYLNKKIYVGILAIVSIVIYLVVIWALPVSEGLLFNNVKAISTTISVDGVFIWFFTKYIWKWRYLHGWLVPFPDLNGTWRGEIKSTWIDPVSKQRPNPIPVILTVNQSFLSVSCVMRTEEMESYSFISDFIVDKEKQILKIIYSYDSIPKQTVKDRSPQHYGTIIFNITNSNSTLTGDYWTGRKSTGSIQLSFWKKEQIDSFPDDMGNHPVGDIRLNEK